MGLALSNAARLTQRVRTPETCAAPRRWVADVGGLSGIRQGACRARWKRLLHAPRRTAAPVKSGHVAAWHPLTCPAGGGVPPAPIARLRRDASCPPVSAFTPPPSHAQFARFPPDDRVRRTARPNCPAPITRSLRASLPCCARRVQDCKGRAANKTPRPYCCGSIGGCGDSRCSQRFPVWLFCRTQCLAGQEVRRTAWPARLHVAPGNRDSLGHEPPGTPRKLRLQRRVCSARAYKALLSCARSVRAGLPPAGGQHAGGRDWPGAAAQQQRLCAARAARAAPRPGLRCALVCAGTPDLVSTLPCPRSQSRDGWPPLRVPQAAEGEAARRSPEAAATARGRSGPRGPRWRWRWRRAPPLCCCWCCDADDE